jgi:hypothetical protein
MIRSAAKLAVRSSASTAALAAVVACALAPATASANPMDLAPERLYADGTSCDPSAPVTAPALACGDLKGTHFQPDNARWAKLVSQYGMAMAPNPMHSARTTGYGGFDFSLFGTMTTVDNGSDWMHKGTEGAISGGNFPTHNASPDGVLQLYGITGRKGLPYGFELQGSVAYMANTEMVVLGGGIRWAILEGFRTGILGYFPDVSVGGYVNTMTGSPKVKITVPSLDIQFSKPFTISNSVVFQPYVGWQLIWIDADSGVVDGTPGFDAMQKCNARPPTAAEQNAGETGGAHCQTRAPNGTYTDAANPSDQVNAQLDVNNNMVFKAIRYRRQRIVVGTAWRYELIHFVLHAAFDAVKPESGGDDRISGLSSQMTFGAMIGASW